MLLCSALLLSFAFAFAQEKGTPADENKKADENSTEKVQSKIPDICERFSLQALYPNIQNRRYER